MKLKNFLEGITILQKYYREPDGYHLSADHDVIYLYGTETPLSEQDLAEMIKLGWFQANSEDGEFKASDYDSDEGWQCYT